MNGHIRKIYYSFPFRLLQLHVHSNLLLLLLWAALAASVLGGWGQTFGLQFLFLDPEYLGEVSFWSFFWIGLSLGGFYVSWNITTYVLNSARFPFLASLSRPFLKFSVNNSFIPVLFLGTYLIAIVRFQYYNELATSGDIVSFVVAVCLGASLAFLLSMAYFRITNKDVMKLRREDNLKLSGRLHRWITKRRTKDIQSQNLWYVAWRVDTFFTERFRLRIVRDVRHYETPLLERVFLQNHTNALVVQTIAISLLILIGAGAESRYFQIPAAASVFILASIFISVIGALTYWLEGWRTAFLLGLLIVVNYLLHFDAFYHKNQAYGLNYEKEPLPYNYETLAQFCTDAHFQRDKDSTLAILARWRQDFPPNHKPKMVLLSVSGGGLRAALWTFKVLQSLDQTTQGEFMKHTVLMTGSSGGMIGAAYYRALYWQKQFDKTVNIQDEAHLQAISQDLMNVLMFSLVVNDLFLPWRNFNFGKYQYKTDRGTLFEEQLNANTKGLLDRPLKDFAQAEKHADIPLLFFTPVIINDGRKLIISAQPVSYMMRPQLPLADQSVEIDNVDFGQVFENYDAANLRVSSALRMSATYPFVLPNVHLPTSPSIEVMDAGFRDNYGLESATRFADVTADWIRKHTSGLIIIQVRGSQKVDKIDKTEKRNIFNLLTSPLGTIAKVDVMQDYVQDRYIYHLKSKIGAGRVKLMRFVYDAPKANERASMSFHLTEKEKNNIIKAIYLENNQNNISFINRILSK